MWQIKYGELKRWANGVIYSLHYLYFNVSTGHTRLENNNGHEYYTILSP